MNDKILVTKSADGRKNNKNNGAPKTAGRFLKWGNDAIGTIDITNAVCFLKPDFNEVTSLYTQGAKSWAPCQFIEFLSERVISRDRRDIERVLFRCGLSQYDVLRIAEITRGIHPKDLLWVASSENETFESALSNVFDSIFHHRIDLAGDSLNTPEGYNIKRYGAYNGQYGIYKQRISPITKDVESEIAVYLLAQKLGVPCCPVYRVDENTVFSAFLYDFSKEYIVHFRRLLDRERSDNEYQNLIRIRPQYKDDFARMILLDFITRQDDRHLSNFAIKINGSESFYPLYDNGRCLFYEDTEETARQAVDCPEMYATAFGYSGTYWDYVREIAVERNGLPGLINLEITESDIVEILKEAGFVGYRLDGASAWIMKAIDMVKSICGGS